MENFGKPLALLLIVFALVVGAHFIVSPWYENSVDVGRMWDIINWAMAAGVVIALAVNFFRKREADAQEAEGAATRGYLSASLAFYASALLALWFFWNWFDNITAGAMGQNDNRRLMWSLINPVFVLVCTHAAVRLWRDEPRG